jgi:pyruvate kinase
MTRRTKIVATVGPASDSQEVLGALIDAGVNVFRLNFSHGESDHHKHVAELIRETAREKSCRVGILADLQGPKIRIAGFVDGSVTISAGQPFSLNLDLQPNSGTDREVGLDYPELCNYVEPGDTLLLDDGRIQLVVEEVVPRLVRCRVTIGGILGSRKGINKLGGGVAAAALTDKDKADIKALESIRPDFVAVSFVSSPADIQLARSLLEAQNQHISIIAKIERAEVVADKSLLDEILLESDGIMVARGDLGVEVGDPELIGIQKYLIRRARQLDRVVITATQMMESMIDSPMPTRAEVFDVANAVLDGTDAVMLSAETAVGRFPTEVVTAMASTCVGAERHPTARTSRYRVDRKFSSADESIAMAAIYAANHFDEVRGILCMTESGRTPLLMSRLSSGLPIFALGRHEETLGRLCLCRGVTPLYFDTGKDSENSLQDRALSYLKDAGYCKTGDSILLTRGDVMGSSGHTNTMKILYIH